MALCIITIAQYGYRNDLWNERIGKIIKVEKEPIWDLGDFYLARPDKRVIIHYSFPNDTEHICKRKVLAKEVLSLVNKPYSKKEDIIGKIDELKVLIKNEKPNEIGG